MSMTPLRRRALVLAVGAISTALALAGCSSSAAPAETVSADSGTRTVEADNGTIEIPDNPQRVVTIGNTTLSFIDLGGRPVGVTEAEASYLDFIPADDKTAYEAATNLGSGDRDLEQIASLKPDLILVQDSDADFEKIEDELEAIAPTLFWGLGTEWKTLAEALADAGNLPNALSDQKSEFDEKIAAMKQKYSGIIESTEFVAVDRGSWNDPGQFAITGQGCMEVARDDLGLSFPEVPDNYQKVTFEQIGELSEYDAILYPSDAEGQPTTEFAPVVETNTWQALPAVTSGRALGLFCPGNYSYGPVLQYLDSLDAALATYPLAE